MINHLVKQDTAIAEEFAIAELKSLEAVCISMAHHVNKYGPPSWQLKMMVTDMLASTRDYNDKNYTYKDETMKGKKISFKLSKHDKDYAEGKTLQGIVMDKVGSLFTFYVVKELQGHKCRKVIPENIIEFID